MRVTVLEDHHFARSAYRKLRQTHRSIGYTAALVAVTAAPT